jgi:hypothetical protein
VLSEQSPEDRKGSGRLDGERPLGSIPGAFRLSLCSQTDRSVAACWNEGCALIAGRGGVERVGAFGRAGVARGGPSLGPGRIRNPVPRNRPLESGSWFALRSDSGAGRSGAE